MVPPHVMEVPLSLPYTVVYPSREASLSIILVTLLLESYTPETKRFPLGSRLVCKSNNESPRIPKPGLICTMGESGQIIYEVNDSPF